MTIDIILLNEHFSDKQSAEDDHLSQDISCQKAADTTLGKNPDDGLYLRYCSLSGLFVSGSRCLPYHKKEHNLHQRYNPNFLSEGAKIQLVISRE